MRRTKQSEFIGEGVTVLADSCATVAQVITDVLVERDVPFFGGTVEETNLSGEDRFEFATSDIRSAGPVRTLRATSGDPKRKFLTTGGQVNAYVQALPKLAGTSFGAYLLRSDMTGLILLTVQMESGRTDVFISYWVGVSRVQLFDTSGGQYAWNESPYDEHPLLTGNWPARGTAFGGAISNVTWGPSKHRVLAENEKAAFVWERVHTHACQLEYDDSLGPTVTRSPVHSIEECGGDTSAGAKTTADSTFLGRRCIVIVRPEDNQAVLSNDMALLAKADDETSGIGLIEYIDVSEPASLVVRKIEDCYAGVVAPTAGSDHLGQEARR